MGHHLSQGFCFFFVMYVSGILCLIFMDLPDIGCRPFGIELFFIHCRYFLSSIALIWQKLLLSMNNDYFLASVGLPPYGAFGSYNGFCHCRRQRQWSAISTPYAVCYQLAEAIFSFSGLKLVHHAKIRTNLAAS